MHLPSLPDEPKSNTTSDTVAVTPAQLRDVATAFRTAKEVPIAVDILSGMVEHQRFEDIQVVVAHESDDAVFDAIFVMDALRTAGYEESFASGVSADRFAAHLRFSMETPYRYISVPGAIASVIQLVHEHYREIDRIIVFAKTNFRNPGTWSGMERETARIIRPLIEFLHSDTPSLAEGSL